MTSTSTDLIVTNDARNETRARIVSACQKRVDFETKERTKRAKQLAKLFKLELAITDKSVTVSACDASDDFIDALHAYGLDNCDFIFDQKRSNQMFNIYAVEKVVYLLRAEITRVVSTMSDYCETTLRNLRFNRVRIEARKLAWSQAHMRVSFDGISRQNVAHSHVKYHKARHVGESTSGTQASSTMRALAAIGVVTVASNAIVRVDYSHKLFSLIAE